MSIKSIDFQLAAKQTQGISGVEVCRDSLSFSRSNDSLFMCARDLERWRRGMYGFERGYPCLF